MLYALQALSYNPLVIENKWRSSNEQQLNTYLYRRKIFNSTRHLYSRDLRARSLSRIFDVALNHNRNIKGWSPDAESGLGGQKLFQLFLLNATVVFYTNQKTTYSYLLLGVDIEQNLGWRNRNRNIMILFFFSKENFYRSRSCASDIYIQEFVMLQCFV